MQAHLAQLALGDICAALDVHRDQADLQAKGLVALGVLGQVIARLSDLQRMKRRKHRALRMILTPCKMLLDVCAHLHCCSDGAPAVAGRRRDS